MLLKFLYGLQKYKTRQLQISGKKYSAIIADSSTKRMIGLMFRSSLKDGECMLFVFPYDGFHSIWMKNMLFPIDAIWLDSSGIVVDVAKGLEICTSIFNCAQYSPKKRARYLIELNSGKSGKVKIGTKIPI